MTTTHQQRLMKLKKKKQRKSSNKRKNYRLSHKSLQTNSAKILTLVSITSKTTQRQMNQEKIQTKQEKIKAIACWIILKALNLSIQKILNLHFCKSTNQHSVEPQMKNLLSSNYKRNRGKGQTMQLKRRSLKFQRQM